MNYRIAIPTYCRPEDIKNKTLSLLEKHNISFNIIDIFVENQEQYNLYADVIDEIKIIITDTQGIGAKRNFIRRYYRNFMKHKYVLMIDDDVEDICDVDGQLNDLNHFIKCGFRACEDRGLNLWGISNHGNTYFMKSGVSTNLKIIAGAWQGIIIDNKKEILQTYFDHFEDIDFTLKHFHRDGGVLRYNGIYLKTKYLCDGGINMSYGGKTERMMAAEMDQLKIDWPGAVKITRNKHGINAQLNWRYILNK